MAYTLVENFSGGVDRSRPRYVGPAGTLWSGINGHLTRGGDFEKRKAFAAAFALPPGQTVGLAKTANGICVFGGAGLPAGMPAGVAYTQLAHPTAPSSRLTSVKSWDQYSGLVYAIGQYENGDVRHFYDGTNVADWGVGGTKPGAWGSIVKTHRRHVFSPIGSVLWESQIDTAAGFDTALGAAFTNMSTHQSGSDKVTGLGTFNELLAVFARRVIQIWSMTDNPANNSPTQFLTETGTRAPRSVRGFGDIDCFYLSDSGIRSLRARSVSNLAGVNDVGTPIDTLVRDYLATLTDTDIENAIGIVEPLDSRFWLAVGKRIFVFSYFPSKKISAWSWYEPGLQFTDMVTVNDRMYARAGDVIYLYGGPNNSAYDSAPVTAALPFLSGGKPGTFKHLKGMNVAASGSWNCSILVDPNDENQYVDVGDLDGVTWALDGIAVPSETTHIAPVLVNESPGYASLSQVGIHTDGAAEVI